MIIMVEGIFKCGEHEFSCDSTDELASHNAEFSHTTKGIAPCNLCGLSTEFSFTGKVGNKVPALCQSCKQSALEGLD